MLNLIATTDEIELITDASCDVDVHASFVDLESDDDVVPGKQNTNITTATTTDVVDGHGGSPVICRNVKTLHIRNAHASSSVVVTVQYDQNGTKFELHKATLLAGEALEYVEGIGFFLLEAPDVTNPVTVARLASNQSNSTTTPTEVTGLTVATGTGTYVFEYYLLTQSGATTTGQKFDVNYDGTVTSFVWNQMWVTNVSAASDDVQDQDHVAAAAAVYSAFSSRAKGIAGRGVTTDVDTANSDLLVRIEGLMIVTVAGNLELWHGSEVAAASTVMAGSSLILTKTA